MKREGAECINLHVHFAKGRVGRYEEDKELEIEFRENPGEDILRFIEQTLRNESCKSDNIQLAEEASSCVMTMQLKLPVRRHVRVTAACLLLKCPCTASGSYHTFL